MQKNKNEISPDQSVELLKELHILTRDGQLNQDSRRKLKQINHLFQFIKPILESYGENDFSIVDHGAGKSYLGFIIYDLYFKKRTNGTIFGVETRDELVLKTTDLAKKLSFDRMKFLNLSVNESFKNETIPNKVELVTALHACDTATDDAIKFAIEKNAEHIVLIPCCQAEVASMLRKNKNDSFKKTPLTEIWRHPIHTRDFGSTLTNVLRCLLLESKGYQVTVTEFVGFEHSMKNELILAKKVDHKRGDASIKIIEILNNLNLNELTSRFNY